VIGGVVVLALAILLSPVGLANTWFRSRLHSDSFLSVSAAVLPGFCSSQLTKVTRTGLAPVTRSMAACPTSRAEPSP
jgi:hypothetical protein